MVVVQPRLLFVATSSGRTCHARSFRVCAKNCQVAIYKAIAWWSCSTVQLLQFHRGCFMLAFDYRWRTSSTSRPYYCQRIWVTNSSAWCRIGPRWHKAFIGRLQSRNWLSALIIIFNIYVYGSVTVTWLMLYKAGKGFMIVCNGCRDLDTCQIYSSY